ncbi:MULTISPECIES: hypothetical protein [unclassified Streptomyces]|uniref:hypothetical protein n=1 Tax=unclassified Streptomyces TaxID=2593676 RepID=UPI001660BEA7|nr:MULTISPECIES: hypothetical protein [unclassified Streptomyces]MBD0707378.1 hypothetical protein [Streptomyces sp. CBMA291]MBD0715170.1 hypothetical protein [Streptomyces sp. CBMA370]
MALCLICAYSTETARTACARCEHRLRGWLGEIPRQVVLLTALLEPGSRPAEGRGGAGRAYSPLPARGDIVSLLGPAAPGPVRDAASAPDQTGATPIHAVLHAWADQLADDLGHDLPPINSRAPYADYLTRHLDHVVRAPWVALMNAELYDLVRCARAITHTEPRRRPMTAPCPSCNAFGLGLTDWAAYVDCEVCGLLLTPAEYDAHHTTVMPGLARTALGLLVAEHLPRKAS